MTISTMPPVAKSSEPEDIFSNLERTQKGNSARPGTGPMMQVPRSSGGMGKKILTVLIVVLFVVAIGGGAFWYFLIRPQSVAVDQAPLPTPPVTDTEPPIPSGAAPSTQAPILDNTEVLPPTTVPEPEVASSSTLPTPVTQPPIDANVPPPTPVTGLPPTSTATTTAPVAEVDTDGDGLNDRRETELGTDPAKADTDGDGLSDGDETLKYRTNPVAKDTDGDTYEDGQEIKGGYNPLGAGKCVNAECIP